MQLGPDTLIVISPNTQDKARAIAETQAAFERLDIDERFKALARAVLNLGQRADEALQQTSRVLIPWFANLNRELVRAFRSCLQCGRVVRLNRGKFPERCRTCGDRLTHARAMFYLSKRAE